ncbi:MAG: S41 family peptidase [Alistipes sp.]|jgi:carboxyl-terminal processing protease|nr:S41 family peptidase [Alistipes sp.]MBR0332827.1 S41 family peptidase [Alistipes sp.]
MYKNSKHTILFPLILAVGVVLGILLGQFVGRNRAESQIRSLIRRSSMNMTNKIMQTSMLVEHRFVDSISMDSLAELVIPLMMRELDPHSVYIPAREMQELNEPLEGEFDGIGVSFNAATDTVIVLSVIPNGPSAKAGIVAGDRIIEINDTLVAGVKMPQNDIVKRLRGRRGTEVRLSLKRQNIDDLVDITVVRDAIPIKSIEAATMLTDSIGFIRLSQFARTSFMELQLALAQLREQGMKKLIFDLRDNSGGFLDQAILIANEFLPAGKLIVYTEDRHREQVKEFSDGTGTATDLALVVLIDEGSASSSEILAGAVQDNDRGTIVGRRSFGKGLVQSQIPYADGSALRLTVARYYTPTGRSIQKPYTNGDEYDYDMDLIRRYNNNEFFSADSIHFADSLKFVTPKGKVVYGGGGIMPDVFIPMDTTDMTRYYAEVSGRNILYRYTLDYADRHREALNAVRTMDELTELLDSDKTLFDDFIRYATAQGVKPVQREIARSRRIMEAQLRAYIGRNTVLEDAAFYYNIMPVDNVLVRSVELLKEMPLPEKEEGEEVIISRTLPEMEIKLNR